MTPYPKREKARVKVQAFSEGEAWLQRLTAKSIFAMPPSARMSQVVSRPLDTTMYLGRKRSLSNLTYQKRETASSSCSMVGCLRMFLTSTIIMAKYMITNIVKRVMKSFVARFQNREGEFRRRSNPWQMGLNTVDRRSDTDIQWKTACAIASLKSSAAVSMKGHQRTKKTAKRNVA